MQEKPSTELHPVNSNRKTNFHLFCLHITFSWLKWFHSINFVSSNLDEQFHIHMARQVECMHFTRVKTSYKQNFIMSICTFRTGCVTKCAVVTISNINFNTLTVRQVDTHKSDEHSSLCVCYIAHECFLHICWFQNILLFTAYKNPEKN